MSEPKKRLSVKIYFRPWRGTGKLEDILWKTQVKLSGMLFSVRDKSCGFQLSLKQCPSKS